jgi:imidazole glycerol-phosphate synthase subunit HisH
MTPDPIPRVAILDYGVGNLFSVRQACEAVDLDARITSEVGDLVSADAVIVPGVGAFGDAMESLRRRDLVEPLRDVAASGKPLIGICLGMQLFMMESEEFGSHRGLGFFEGSVRYFRAHAEEQGRVKVPHVGWHRIFPQELDPSGRAWVDSPLEGVGPGEFVYFVHSLYVQAEDSETIMSLSRFGDFSYCSSLRRDNLFAFQFHPERSGEIGLGIYRNLARHIADYAISSTRGANV